MTLSLYTLHVIMRTEDVLPEETPASFPCARRRVLAIGAVYVYGGRRGPLEWVVAAPVRQGGCSRARQRAGTRWSDAASSRRDARRPTQASSDVTSAARPGRAAPWSAPRCFLASSRRCLARRGSAWSGAARGRRGERGRGAGRPAARGRRPGCGAGSGARRRRRRAARRSAAGRGCAAPGARCGSVSAADDATSYSSSTRLSVVLTDWPPGPEDRENRSTSSAAGITSPSGRPGPGRHPQVAAGRGSPAARRRHSIAGQVSITIGTPAARVRSNAVVVDHAELEPHAPGADRDGLVGELAGRLRAPEHVDDVDRERHVGERGVALLAEDGRRVGVDRHDPLAALLQQPRRCEYAVRVGLPDRPTTAQVSQSSSMNRIVSGSCQSAMRPSCPMGPARKRCGYPDVRSGHELRLPDVRPLRGAPGDPRGRARRVRREGGAVRRRRRRERPLPARGGRRLARPRTSTHRTSPRSTAAPAPTRWPR